MLGVNQNQNHQYHRPLSPLCLKHSLCLWPVLRHSQRYQLVSCSSWLSTEACRSAPASSAESSGPPPSAGREPIRVGHRTRNQQNIGQKRRPDDVRRPDLVHELFAPPLVAPDSLLVLLALLLLHYQLRLQLSHLHTAATSASPPHSLTPHLCVSTHSRLQFMKLFLSSLQRHLLRLVQLDLQLCQRNMDAVTINLQQHERRSPAAGELFHYCTFHCRHHVLLHSLQHAAAVLLLLQLLRHQSRLVEHIMQRLRDDLYN